jgi:tRNA threonylcarbamoyladenosine biosynthesis protein TsaB
VREELRGDNRRKIVLGDGALLCHDDLSENGISCELAPAARRWQNAVGVALAAQAAYARGEACTAQALRPVYLRISQAERERSARLQKQGEQN